MAAARLGVRPLRRGAGRCDGARGGEGDGGGRRHGAGPPRDRPLSARPRGDPGAARGPDPLPRRPRTRTAGRAARAGGGRDPDDEPRRAARAGGVRAADGGRGGGSHRAGRGRGAPQVGPRRLARGGGGGPPGATSAATRRWSSTASASSTGRQPVGRHRGADPARGEPDRDAGHPVPRHRQRAGGRDPRRLPRHHRTAPRGLHAHLADHAGARDRGGGPSASSTWTSRSCPRADPGPARRGVPHGCSSQPSTPRRTRLSATGSSRPAGSSTTTSHWASSASCLAGQRVPDELRLLGDPSGPPPPRPPPPPRRGRAAPVHVHIAHPDILRYGSAGPSPRSGARGGLRPAAASHPGALDPRGPPTRSRRSLAASDPGRPRARAPASDPGGGGAGCRGCQWGGPAPDPRRPTATNVQMRDDHVRPALLAGGPVDLRAVRGARGGEGRRGRPRVRPGEGRRRHRPGRSVGAVAVPSGPPRGTRPCR
ncbi:hypothetical protein SCALM49S_01020 [Streptomyces californicus]